MNKVEIFLVPAQINDINSKVDNHFGQSNWYLVVDSEGSLIESIPGNQHSHHKGIYNWKNKLGFTKILTSHMGPGAYDVAAYMGIDIYMVPPGESLLDAVKKYNDGQLTALSSSEGLSCGGNCH